MRHGKFTVTILFYCSLKDSEKFKYSPPEAFIASTKGETTQCDPNSNPSSVHKLKESLLCGYNPSIRPVKNKTQKISVTLDLDFRHIDVDETRNMVTSEIFLSMLWEDEYLQWDANESEVNLILLPADSVWIPDLTVYNNWESWSHEISLYDHKAVVMRTGHVFYATIVDIPSFCLLDVTYWPYDVNVCSVALSSRSYFSDVIEFELETHWNELPRNTSFENNMWGIRNISSNVQHYFNDTEENSAGYRLSTIVAHMTIERTSTSLYYTFSTPIAMIVLTLLVTFWIEPFEAYRTVLGLFSMIGHISYLMLLAHVIPSNGQKPVLIVTLVRNSLILCWASLVLHASERMMCQSGKNPPNCLLSVATWVRQSRLSFFIPGESKRNEGTDDIKATKAFEWVPIVAIIDRFVFIVYTFIYLVMWFGFNYVK